MGLAAITSRAILTRLWQEINEPNGQDWAPLLAGAAFTSNQPTETYGGVGNVKPMTEWEGHRKPHNLVPKSLTIANKNYSAEFDVTYEDRKYNKVQAVERSIQALGIRYRQHWYKLLTAVLTGNPTGYDGVALFSASHAEVNSGTQSNLISQSGGANPTASTFETGVLTAMQRFSTFKDDQGEPYDSPDDSYVIMIPPTMRAAAMGAMGAAVIADATPVARTNLLMVFGAQVVLVVNKRLTATDKAYVFRNDGRALIRQEVLEPPTSAMAEGSEYEHSTKNWQFGVFATRGAGPGNWQSATQITFS